MLPLRRLNLPRHTPCTTLRALSSSSSSKPPKLIYPSPPTKDHASLASFLSYAARTKLSAGSSVYRGTHYEYTVARSLSAYGFSLRRVGGASDRGLDLLGEWRVPGVNKNRGGVVMRVVVQCKAGGGASGPQYARELRGAMGSAPAGWRTGEGGGDGDGRGGNGGNGEHVPVMGLLVGERPATRGVLKELREGGPLAMGYVCCSRDGEVLQMLWNGRARDLGLEGVEVGVQYVEGGGGKKKRLVLMEGGKMVPLLDVREEHHLD